MLTARRNSRETARLVEIVRRRRSLDWHGWLKIEKKKDKRDGKDQRTRDENLCRFVLLSF